MGRYCRRHKQSLSGFRRNGGQSTVEFALVTAGLIALLVALGIIWRVLDGGLFVSHAIASASHHLFEVPASFLADIFRY